MNINQYKISFYKIIKFAIIVLMVDFVVGSISQKIFYSQETGKFARTTHTIKKTKADILIFGSSHAHRHYVPEVLEKELNKTCYNAGAEGQQLLFHTALQEMVLKRTTPDVMILNIDDSFLYQSQVAYDRLSDLHPYYEDHTEELKPILEMKSSLVDLKLFFKSYQTNSTIVHAFRYYISPQIDYKGYRPLYGKIIPEKIPLNKEENTTKEYVEVIDPNFVNALKTFINNAREKKVHLVFVTSPTFDTRDYSENESFLLIKDIAEKQEVPLLNFFNDKQFYKKPELFHDPSHLNDKGARLFSERLADAILKMDFSKK